MEKGWQRIIVMLEIQPVLKVSLAGQWQVLRISARRKHHTRSRAKEPYSPSEPLMNSSLDSFQARWH